MPYDLKQVMRDAKLTSTARLAYLWLRWTAKRDGYAYHTNAELGEYVGISKSQMATIAAELIDAGLVRRESPGKGAGGPGLRRWVILGIAGAIAAGTGTAAEQSAASFALHSQVALCGHDCDAGALECALEPDGL